MFSVPLMSVSSGVMGGVGKPYSDCGRSQKIIASRACCC